MNDQLAIAPRIPAGSLWLVHTQKHAVVHPLQSLAGEAEQHASIFGGAPKERRRRCAERTVVQKGVFGESVSFLPP